MQRARLLLFGIAGWLAASVAAAQAAQGQVARARGRRVRGVGTPRPALPGGSGGGDGPARAQPGRGAAILVLSSPPTRGSSRDPKRLLGANAAGRLRPRGIGKTR